MKIKFFQRNKQEGKIVGDTKQAKQLSSTEATDTFVSYASTSCNEAQYGTKSVRFCEAASSVHMLQKVNRNDYHDLWYHSEELLNFRNETNAVANALFDDEDGELSHEQSMRKALTEAFEKCVSVTSEAGAESKEAVVDRKRLRKLYQTALELNGLESVFYRRCRGDPSQNNRRVLEYCQESMLSGCTEEHFRRLSQAGSRASRILARELGVAHASAVKRMA